MRVHRAFILILCAILLSAGTVSAQKYAYEVGITDKDINLNLLNLPGSTPLVDVLALLPEFLAPDLSLAFGQYDIQIEDISVDCAANSIIKNMHLSDLKSITISENPPASQQKNSSGGVINLQLNDVPDGLNGRVSLNLSSSSEYQPSAIINYHKNKLTVRSWLMFDQYTPQQQHEYRTLDSEHGTFYAIDTTRSNRSSQMVRIYADYAATANDDFQFRVWESTGSTINHNYMQVLPYGLNDAGGSSTSKANNLAVNATYTHRTTKGDTLKIEFGHLYMPQYGKDMRRNTLNVDGDPSRTVQTLFKTHQTNAELYYTFPLIKSGDKTRMVMKAGSNMTAISASNEYTEEIRLSGLLTIPSHIDGDIRTSYPESSLFVSPYIEIDGIWEKFRYKANIKYQYLKNTAFQQNGVADDLYVYTKDFTGNLNFGWQMTPHQHLRFVLDRSIIQPSSWQMMPIVFYRPDMGCYVMGSTGLRSSKLHSINFNYVTDQQIRNSNILVNAALGVIHAEDLITSVHKVYVRNAHLPYISYENSGTSNILKANLLCCLRNGPLMLTFSTSVFDKLQWVKGQEDNKVYYNLSAGAVYSINSQWTLAGEMTFNRPVSSQTVIYSPVLNGTIRVSKAWKKLESFIAVANIMHNTRREVTITPELTTYRYYDIYPSSLTLGMSYHF